MMKLSRIRLSTRQKMASRKVEKMWQNANMFIAMRLFFFHIRFKRKNGRDLQSRHIRLHIRPKINLFTMCIHEKIRRACRAPILALLQSLVYFQNFKAKVSHFFNCIYRIEDFRIRQNFGKLLRTEYLHKVFDKERDFIAKFYERKYSKRGKEVHDKIAGISDTVQREMLYLYLLVK